MNKNNQIRVIKVPEIGNMFCIDDCIEIIINDAMERCEEGSLVWTTYQAVLEMMKTINDTYESEFKRHLKADNLQFLTKLIGIDHYLKN